MDSFVLPANTLARMTVNAQLFLSNIQEQWKVAEVTYGFGYLTVTACDSVIMGRETVLAMTQGNGRFTLTKESLKAIDEAVRPQKKEPVRVQVNGNVLMLSIPGEDGEDSSWQEVECAAPEPGIWEKAGRVLQRTELAERNLPPLVAFDSSRLAKLCRVKADQTDRVIDMSLSDNYEPVLVKIGADWTGLIMPIQREVHADMVGADGLWPES